MIANFPSRNVSITLLIGIIFLLAVTLLFYTQTKTLGNKIYPYTFIDSVDVGGKTKEEALQILDKKYDYLNDVKVTVLYKDNPVASFSAEQLGLERDNKQVVDHAFIIGRTPHIPSRILQQFNALFHIKKYNFYTTIRYHRNVVDDFSQEMEDSYGKQAKNALFTFENNKVTSFKADEKGIKIKTDEFKITFNTEIQKVKNGSSLVLVLKDEVLLPEVTLAQANNLGIEQLIGEGQSDYSHSIPGRVFNVKLAASKYNGVIIPKGEEFSFNEVIGDISAASGYQPAYIIKNGRTVLGDGGGVCQVSTTLFRAALNSGLPITERNAHAYRVSYYENDSKPGLDATIFTPSVDLRFTNNTQAAILIQTEIEDDNNILRFKFYGKKDNRKIEISPITIWDVVPPPEPLYEDDPNLPAGMVKQVDYPAWGSKTKFTYRVTNPNGESFEKEFYSSYRPWQAVFMRGTKT